MCSVRQTEEARCRRRTALVTGSSNGIGESIVKELAKLDYKLVVTGRCAPDISRVADLCAKLSPSCEKPLEIVADLAREAEVKQLFCRSMEHFGDKLNLLVNNAGFGPPVAHTQMEACYETFKKIQQINLFAVVQLSLMAAPKLKATGELYCETTSIVNVSSIAAFRPTPSLFAYGTSKAALNMLTGCLAVELGPTVRVNCVSPGPIETKIIERSGFCLDTFKCIASTSAPLGRIGEPGDVAEAVVFLADPKRAGYITGANLTVDGGCLLAPLRYD